MKVKVSYISKNIIILCTKIGSLIGNPIHKGRIPMSYSLSDRVKENSLEEPARKPICPIIVPLWREGNTNLSQNLSHKLVLTQV